MSPDKLVGKSIEMINFVAKFIAHDKGGRLTIASKNVSLHVPPYALPATKQPVGLHVCL